MIQISGAGRSVPRSSCSGSSTIKICGAAGWSCSSPWSVLRISSTLLPGFRMVAGVVVPSRLAAGYPVLGRFFRRWFSLRENSFPE
eukprot:13563343-Heterocapsa_arctica.AAC.1